MFALIAFILFTLAFAFHAAGFAHSSLLDWQSLMLAGLACAALHLLGAWTALPWRR